MQAIFIPSPLGIQNNVLYSQPLLYSKRIGSDFKCNQINVSFSHSILRKRNYLNAKFRTLHKLNVKSNLSETSNEEAEETDAIIIGAGLAGLSAAKKLNSEGVSFLLLESSDAVGGRVRTDEVNGFLLDRGFQIFLSAYPECKKELDYEDLDLKPFYAGAMVWFDNSFHRVSDPFRHPWDGILSLTNPIGSVIDKVLVGLLRLKAVIKSYDSILNSQEDTIESRLKSEGFSSKMIDRFFRPFFGGIFFDRQLQTTSRLLEFVFKILALGSNTVPSLGIQVIPNQIASSLPSSSIRLNTRVTEIIRVDSSLSPTTRPGVLLENGKKVFAKKGIIVAVEGPEAARLLNLELASRPVSKNTEPRRTVCLYFSAPKPATDLPILYLNGTEKGIVNNMCFISNVAPSYAPAGQALVSVSLIGLYQGVSDTELESQVREELGGWFGIEEVSVWKHLRTYRIPFAQPNQFVPTDLVRETSLGNGLYVCGDHRYSSTFDAAMVSGRVAAESLLTETKIKK